VLCHVLVGGLLVTSRGLDLGRFLFWIFLSLFLWLAWGVLEEVEGLKEM